MKKVKETAWGTETSETLFHSLAETTSAAIFIVRDMKIQYANPAAAYLTAYPAEALVDKKFTELIHPDYRPLIEQNGIVNQWTDTAPSRYEIKILRQDGEERWIDLSAGRLQSDESAGIVITAFDITAREMAERELRQAKAELEDRVRERTDALERARLNLEAIFKSVAETVIVYNQAGVVVQANPASVDMYGFDPTGKSIKELHKTLTVYRPDGSPVSPEQWPSSRALRGETVTRERIALTNRQGRAFHTVVSAVPLYVDGQFVGAVTTINNVTEQERLLAEVARRAEELDAVIHSMPEAVLIFDASGKVVMMNPSAADIFGREVMDLSGEEFAGQLNLTRPNGEPVGLDDLPIQRALRGERLDGKRYTYQPAGGDPINFLVYVSPLRNGERITGAVAVWHDITEQEQLFNQLEAERARLSAVIANAPEAIVVTDEKGTIIMANPVAERLYGHPIPYGEHFMDRAGQRICYPDGRPYDPRELPLTRSALDGEVVTNVEAMIELPDGTQRHILINSGPIFDRNGKIAGAIAISQDIGPRKQIEAQIRKNAARAEVLASLSQAFAEAGLYYAAVLSTITHQITEKIGDGSIIRMISDDNKWLDVVAVHHPEHEALSELRRILRRRRLRVDEGLSGQALRTRRPLLIQDPAAYPDHELLAQEYNSWLQDTGARSLLVIPLQAQGSLIGTLSVIRPRNGEVYDADDQIFFMSLADRAAMSIENAILFADEARRARELDALHSATSALLSTLDLNELLSEILDAAQSAIAAAERGALHLVEPDTGKLEIRATLNYKDPRIARISHPNGTDYPSVVVRNKKPLLIHDALTNPEAAHNLHDKQTGSFRSLIIAPLFYGEDVIGTLSLTAARPFAFTKEDLRLLVSFATTTSAAIQNAMLHAKVQTMAITDPLTEQYNRRGFFDLAQREMERFSRYHYPLAAIMLDIDRFKEVNDTYGHRTGDRVLRALAERITQNIRQVDILGRYGGEEFAILLPETELFKACEIAERIRSAVANQPIVETEQGPVSVSISVGVTRATKATTTLAELLEQADKALYMAKEKGRNRVEIL